MGDPQAKILTLGLMGRNVCFDSNLVVHSLVIKYVHNIMNSLFHSLLTARTPIIHIQVYTHDILKEGRSVWIIVKYEV